MGDADPAAARKTYVLSENFDFTQGGETSSFSIVNGSYKLIVFGHGDYPTFNDYKPLLFNLANVPEESSNLATTLPDVVSALEALIQAELSTGANAYYSPTGDWDAID